MKAVHADAGFNFHPATSSVDETRGFLLITFQREVDFTRENLGQETFVISQSIPRYPRIALSGLSIN